MEDDPYQMFSNHLYWVLDVLGVSEDKRKTYREYAKKREVLEATMCEIRFKVNPTIYVVGSQLEGTTTRNMKSDTDLLIVREFPVIETLKDAPETGGALLIVPGDTKAGYVKLQEVMHRFRLPIYRKHHVFSNDKQHKDFYSRNPAFRIKHGPSDTVAGDDFSTEIDNVFSYVCHTIPGFANEWLHRRRQYQWPSKKQLKKMATYGCFFVGIGHPDSRSKNEEWRISFSLQERELMLNLNPTQHRCYVLLKMIKKSIIQQKVGESLSSYHCKTCLFHMIENRTVDIWKPGNLVLILLDCLKLLLQWAENGNCPNYFIKEENMFDKLSKEPLNKVATVLQSLLNSGMYFLFSIECDNLGDCLKHSLHGKDLVDLMPTEETRLMEETIDAVETLHYIRLCNIRYACDFPREFSSRIVGSLQNFEQLNCNTKKTNAGIDSLMPHNLRLTVAQTKTVDCLVKKGGKDLNERLLEIQNAKDCDILSTKLTIAAIYLHCDQFEKCEQILLESRKMLKPFFISICGCNRNNKYDNKALAEKLMKGLAFEEFQRECTAACIVLPPPLSSLAHEALLYEMYRSVFTTPGSRDEERCFWFDWMVVDAKVYLYFLQYVLYSKTNKIINKRDTVEDLRLLLNKDYGDLRHKETAFNILGWMYCQENRNSEAYWCFCRSWRIRPVHNAAKWHVLMLLHSLVQLET